MCGKRWRWPEWVSLRWRGLGRARAGPTLGRRTVNRDAPKKRKGRSRGGLTADGDEGSGEGYKIKQGALKKTSGRSYSLERPVARHFVWHG